MSRLDEVDLAWSLDWFEQWGHTLTHNGKPIAGPVLAELERLRAIERRARAVAASYSDNAGQAARHILGEQP